MDKEFGEDWIYTKSSDLILFSFLGIHNFCFQNIQNTFFSNKTSKLTSISLKIKIKSSEKCSSVHSLFILTHSFSIRFFDNKALWQVDLVASKYTVKITFDRDLLMVYVQGGWVAINSPDIFLALKVKFNVALPGIHFWGVNIICNSFQYISFRSYF